MDSFFVRTVAPFVVAVACQLGAIAALPRTQGFTAAVPTAICLAIFGVSLWMIARIAHGGASLGILIPLLNAIVPLGAMSIGVLMYGETASALRVALLITACALIGVASRVH